MNFRLRGGSTPLIGVPVEIWKWEIFRRWPIFAEKFFFLFSFQKMWPQLWSFQKVLAELKKPTSNRENDINVSRSQSGHFFTLRTLWKLRTLRFQTVWYATTIHTFQEPNLEVANSATELHWRYKYYHIYWFTGKDSVLFRTKEDEDKPLNEETRELMHKFLNDKDE